MSGLAERWGSTDVALAAPQAEASSVFVGYPWEGVARLIDRAPSIHDLRVHRLELLAAALYRERGLPEPPELAADVMLARVSTLAATALVQRIRDACTGPLLVFKGLEAAGRYPAWGLRPFGDVDVLVPDPDAVQRQLEAAGFEPVGHELDWDELHHLERLGPPDRLFAVEVHKYPKWVEGLSAPDAHAVLADAVPSASGVDGVLAPKPAVHAVLLAAHAWAERPLGCIGDLVDVAAMTRACASGEVEEVARRYGLERVWSATVAAGDALFPDGEKTWPLRSWARHLPDVREPTVLESHLRRVLAPFAALPPSPALRGAAHGLAHAAKPVEGEGWRSKLSRTTRAVRDASVRRSEHERRIRDRQGRP